MKDGHYSVIKQIGKNSLRLWNPSTGKQETYDKESFTKNWKDTTRGGKMFHNLAMILWQ